MENNLYQIQIEERLKGYVIIKNNLFFGIIYNKDKFDYIYGKHIFNEKIDICINGFSNENYVFLTMGFARDGVPYERFALTTNYNVNLLLMHYDLNIGFEADRVDAISAFVNEKFDNHMMKDEQFAESYCLYFKDEEPFQKTKTLIADEKLPF